MMSFKPTLVAKVTAANCVRAKALSHLAARFAADSSGSSLIEYALTLGGVALSATGLASTLGLEITHLFDAFGFNICLQVSQVCVAR